MPNMPPIPCCGCLALPNGRRPLLTLPSHHLSPVPVLAFCLSDFTPTPQPYTPPWPPFDPLLPSLPPPHPAPSTSFSPGQAHSAQPFVPSFPSLLLHLCLPLPLCVRGQLREREEGGCSGGESETWPSPNLSAFVLCEICML
ncbi:unnamed protein product, partial [Pleuronectes platessa]